MEKTQVVSISGGLGTGKTHVCDLFATIHGIPVYNADLKVKEKIVNLPEVSMQIKARFGRDSYLIKYPFVKDFFDDVPIEPTLVEYNIEKFKKLLFTDKEALKDMNNIIQPALLSDINIWVMAKSKIRKYVIVECATVFENNMFYLFDTNIVVTCPLDIRIQRLTKDRKMTFEDIQNRIKNQWSDDKKLRMADYEIINDGSNDVLQQIAQIHKDLIWNETDRGSWNLST